MQKLRAVSQQVAPLYLVDSASPEFVAERCQTVHDITRFIHEKVFEDMFHLGDTTVHPAQHFSILKDFLPYTVRVLDLGGGVSHAAPRTNELSRADIESVPMTAFVKGLFDSRIARGQPRALSATGYLSVLGESIAGPPAEAKGVGGASFAIISDRYMNFSTRAGYHFSTVDTYCGKSINKNYIHFRFEGGGASETRRQRRCQFLFMVLQNLNFEVKQLSNAVVGRLEKYDQEFIKTRLTDLGRLTICSRQLDMLMDSNQSADFFAQAFLEGRSEVF
jgi:pyruvate,water dikinase